MLRSAFILLIISFLCVFNSAAQGVQHVLPNLQGQELMDSLESHYRPIVVLEYGPARDTLFAKILAKDDDTLRCIYSGHALYLDPTQDPTQYVYQNGGTMGINTEHSYPQSKGAANGNPRSDMHHLFPTRIPVNEARGSVPYGDIPDAQTDKWFYKSSVLTNIPNTNKDAYSEYETAQYFEPRESVKGDIARAILYFYTVYKAQADAADPIFFANQRTTLCQWQAQDPADDAELLKTWRIAAYQENKPNPYILDCTLAFRTFCPEIAPNCLINTKEKEKDKLEIKIVPQPFMGGSTRIEMILPFSGNVMGFVRSSTGQELVRFSQDEVSAGNFQWALDLETKNMPAVGFLEIHLMGKNGERMSQVLPLVGF
jgi:endonuclease I